MSHLSISPSVTLSALFSELAGGTAPSSSPQGMADAVAKALMAQVGDGHTPEALSPVSSADAGPRLGDTLTQGLGASKFVSVGSAPTGPTALQALAAAEGRPAHSPTLQDMAQAVPRHDIAAGRHGHLVAEGSPAPASPSPTPLSTVADRPGAVAPTVAHSPAAARADAVVAEAQLTQAPVALLHPQATEFRTHAPEPRDDDEPRRERRAAGGNEDGADPQDGAAARDDQDDAAAGVEAAPVDTATDEHHLPADARPGLAGDAALYQQIVSALHAVGTTSGPVAELLEELRRQRRVVLATPSSLTAGLRCNAHVDVLWPVAGGGRALRLSGELLWAQAGHESDWLMAHLVKSQAQGHVRQLSPVGNDAGARCIAVCLGAQATPMLAWSQACLRVRDATRLWQALEMQWSLRLVIGTLPLSLQAGPPSSPHPHGRVPHGA